MEDLGELLDIAIRAAAAGAELALRYRAEGIGTVETKSTATDPVTAADRAVERLVTGMLLANRPNDRVLGEEFGEAGEPNRGQFGEAGEPSRGQSGEAGEPSRGQSGQGAGAADAPGVRWVVDPIDGTVNFVYGLPQFAVSIAAEIEGEVVVGVVRNAVTGEQWTAVRGGGAWLAGARLHGSAVTSLGQSLVATGFGYDAARRAHQAGVLTRLLPRVRDIRRFGAASLDLCLAATGRVDAYFEKGLAPWDHAAGGLVAREAGLLVTGLRGAPPSRAMVVAAPPAVHAALHDLLVELDADGGA